MSYYSRYSYYPPYVPVAERRRQAEQRVAKLKKKGVMLSPISLDGHAIAKTFWGKAWCTNLESYSDYANRLPRGRSYVRIGAVIDLHITAGQVNAQVMGSHLYTTTVKVTALPKQRWQAISRDCAGTIDSLVELLRGRFSKNVMERMCRQGEGLFPSPKEVKFSCSCPDGARMCKHVAAVMFGIGARLDRQPELLFMLRKVDAKELVAQASDALPALQIGRKGITKSKLLDSASLADVFGIEVAEGVADAAIALPPRKKAAAVRKRSMKKDLPKTIPVSKKVMVKKSARKKPAAAPVRKKRN